MDEWTDTGGKCLGDNWEIYETFLLLFFPFKIGDFNFLLFIILHILPPPPPLLHFLFVS